MTKAKSTILKSQKLLEGKTIKLSLKPKLPLKSKPTTVESKQDNKSKKIMVSRQTQIMKSPESKNNKNRRIKTFKKPEDLSCKSKSNLSPSTTIPLHQTTMSKEWKRKNSSLKTELSTLDSGTSRVERAVGEFKFGSMDLSTKDTGSTTRQTDAVV